MYVRTKGVLSIDWQADVKGAHQSKCRPGSRLASDGACEYHVLNIASAVE